MIKEIMTRSLTGLFIILLLGVVSFAQQQHIFYRGTDGHINQLSFDGDSYYKQWTVEAKAPFAAGRPAVMLTGN